MRRLIPPGRVDGRRASAIALALALGLGPVAVGQEDPNRPEPVPAPDRGIAVGMEVVLKAPGHLATGDGDSRPVPVRAGTRLRVERVEHAYVLVSGADGHRRGWAGIDQVLPLDRAADYFDRAIARKPDDVEAYRARGRVRAARGLADDALADLDRAIELDPNEASTYASRAEVRASTGRLNAAIADYTQAIRRDPRVADVYASRGRVWMAKHDPRQAIGDYSTAIEFDPREVSFYLLRGAAWSRRGEHAPAMEDFDEAVRLAPNDPAPYIARATEWEKDLKPERALPDYQMALTLDPRNVAAYEGRGRIWRKEGEYEKVVANFAELARIVPNEPVGHRALAWILATCDRDSIRDGRRAVAEATVACRLTNWEDVDGLEAMAAACAEAADFDAAVKWQSSAIEVFNAGLDRIDRRLLTTKRKDADLSHRLYRYKKRLPYHERSDRAFR